jgi:hypothetical protein
VAWYQHHISSTAEVVKCGIYIFLGNGGSTVFCLYVITTLLGDLWFVEQYLEYDTRERC